MELAVFYIRKSKGILDHSFDINNRLQNIETDIKDDNFHVVTKRMIILTIIKLNATTQGLHYNTIIDFKVPINFTANKYAMAAGVSEEQVPIISPF